MTTNIGSIETGITPSGTKSITSNGTYDVTNYAKASVNVSSNSGIAYDALTNASYTIKNSGYVNIWVFRANGINNVTVTYNVYKNGSVLYSFTGIRNDNSTFQIYENVSVYSGDVISVGYSGTSSDAYVNIVAYIEEHS